MFSMKSEDGMGMVGYTLILGLAVVVVAVVAMVVLAAVDASSLQELKEGVEVFTTLAGAQ